MSDTSNPGAEPDAVALDVASPATPPTAAAPEIHDHAALRAVVTEVQPLACEPLTLAGVEALAKSYLRSKTLWGLVVVLFASWAQSHGQALAPSDQQALLSGVMDLVRDAGAVLAIVGRATARAPLR